MQSRGVASLCREYATFSREAALPLCEEQDRLIKKMVGVDALCARIIYLMALRSNELSSCASALRDMPQISTQLAETNALLEQCTAHMDRLNALLPPVQRLEPLAQEAAAPADVGGDA